MHIRFSGGHPGMVFLGTMTMGLAQGLTHCLFQFGQLFPQPVNMVQGDVVRSLRNWGRVSGVNVHFNQACVTNIKMIGGEDVSVFSTQLLKLF